MRILSLFSGVGGADIGLEMAGHEIIALCEIEPHAQAVLRRHWPNVPLHDDVATLDGTAYRGRVDAVVGGSPCQDLSIAGKRAGMTEGSGTRSSLYFEQVRVWRESEADYLIWENVLGALSSNAGRDFAAVLSALVGAPLAVPDDGWRGAGVASGPAGVAAWRVLDAQFFGVPQRRRRVFVVCARAGGRDPGEILALGERLSGHPAPCREAGEGTAADVGEGAALAFNWQSGGDCRLGESDTLVSAIQANQTPAVIDFAQNTRDEVRQIPGDVVCALAAQSGMKQQNYVMRQREGKPGGGKGPLLSAERSLTLGTANDQVLFSKMQYGAYEDAPSVASTLGARDHASQNTDVVVSASLRARAPRDSSDGSTEETLPIAASGIPRRLMPVECERLMGWPDGHTATGIDADGREYALSDTARYKLCGNGIASPCTAWLGFRLDS